MVRIVHRSGKIQFWFKSAFDFLGVEHGYLLIQFAEDYIRVGLSGVQQQLIYREHHLGRQGGVYPEIILNGPIQQLVKPHVEALDVRFLLHQACTVGRKARTRLQQLKSGGATDGLFGLYQIEQIPIQSHRVAQVGGRALQLNDVEIRQGNVCRKGLHLCCGQCATLLFKRGQSIPNGVHA